MRIDNLTIGNYRNLRNLSVNFDESSFTTVLMGRNGSGKSNLIEAVVIIFRNLYLRRPPEFPYRIRYFCRNHAVEIDADPDRTPIHTSIHVDDLDVSFTRLVETEASELLPAYVFGYYSGTSHRLERYFLEIRDRYYRELIRSDASDQHIPLRPLFYAQDAHSQFVLLSFFVEEEEETRKLLRDYLRIVDFESVLFVLKKPDWARKQGGDQRFWGAVGVVQGFLDKLFTTSLAPVRVPISRGRERIYLFIKDASDLQKLYGNYGNQMNFFKTLESAFISDLIEEVRIRVRIRGTDRSVTFSELSEGEQQLLTVLGLLRFNREEESVFLLDEPDTYLNPAWSVSFLELIRTVVRPSERSHVIMATHDPLTIGGLSRTEVQNLYRDPASGRIAARQPEDDPKGSGVAALLTSELFGLRSTVDLDTLRRIDRRRQLASRANLAKHEVVELETLNQQVGDIDLTDSVRDPSYRLFVNALERSENYDEFKKPVLSPDEQARLEDLADQALREIRSLRKP